MKFIIFKNAFKCMLVKILPYSAQVVKLLALLKASPDLLGPGFKYCLLLSQ